MKSEKSWPRRSRRSRGSVASSTPQSGVLVLSDRNVGSEADYFDFLFFHRARAAFRAISRRRVAVTFFIRARTAAFPQAMNSSVLKVRDFFIGVRIRDEHRKGQGNSRVLEALFYP